MDEDWLYVAVILDLWSRCVVDRATPGRCTPP